MKKKIKLFLAGIVLFTLIAPIFLVFYTLCGPFAYLLLWKQVIEDLRDE